MTTLRRSLLFVPGSNARAMEKAQNLRSDAIIFDLEDAVSPAQKAEARSQVANAIRGGGFASPELLVRVNEFATEWASDDLKMVADVQPDGVVLPKVSESNVLTETIERLGSGKRTQLWAMIESPLGVLEAHNLAAFARRSRLPLAGLIAGTNDIARETGARQVAGRLPLLLSLSHCILAARAFGLVAIDGVYNNFKDAPGFEAECAQARDLGFDGKTLIHPDQVRACNAAFSPSEQEIARARAIVQAFETETSRGQGAVQLNGEMIELLHLEMAKRTLAAGRAAEAEAVS